MYIYIPLCRYWIALYRYVLVFIMPHVDIELEDNKQFISYIPRKCRKIYLHLPKYIRLRVRRFFRQNCLVICLWNYVVTRKLFKKVSYNYSQFSLSWLRLSQINNYLEVKIWSLFIHESPTGTCIGILWKSGEIASKELLCIFSVIFSIPSNFRSQITYSFMKRIVWFIFSQFCKSDISRYGHLKVF